MHIWFWAWVLLACILAFMELFDREYFTLPWAFGAALAALLEGFGAAVAWQWVAFAGVSGGLLVAIQRFRAPGRKSLERERRATR